MIKKLKLPIGDGPIKQEYNLTKADPVYRQIRDMMHDPMDGALFFMSNCCWVKRNGIVKYTPREYQREMIFDYNCDKWKNTISLLARQMGKTTTSAGYLLWYAIVNPSKDILVTSYGEKSAIEIMEVIKTIYEYCPNFLKLPMVESNKTSVKFSNNSRIFCRPTTVKAARGLSPAIIYCDEFAFVGNGESASKTMEKQEEFFSAVTPALSASKGKLFITSTPLSQTDMFYKIWSGAINKLDDNNLQKKPYWILKENEKLYTNNFIFDTEEEAKEFVLKQTNPDVYKIVSKEPLGNNEFMSIFADWTKDPTKTPEWAEAQKKTMSDDKFQREFCCVGKNAMVTVQDGKNIINIPIEELYNLCGN